MAPGHDVLERGHVEKDLQVLERAPDAGSGEFVRRRAGKVALAEDDAARARHIDAGQEVEQGRLARAIGADDRMNRSGSGLPREIIDGAHSAEFLRQPLDAQRAHWAPTLAASLANSAAALPPEGEQFAPWGGPAAGTLDPHACGFAAALPPEGEQFPPWGGPAAGMALSGMTSTEGASCARLRRTLRVGSSMSSRSGHATPSSFVKSPSSEDAG